MNKKIIYSIIAILCLEVVFLSLKHQRLISKYKNLENILSSENNINDLNILNGSIEITEWKQGNNSMFPSIIEKKGLILFYFSAECYSCNEISMYWNYIYNKYEKDFYIFGLSKSKKKAVSQYVMRNNIMFPVFLLKRADENIDAILIQSPLTITVGRNGIVRNLYQGIIDENSQVIEEIEKWEE